jgi:tetratricopeptide (TPR) repeat protein
VTIRASLAILMLCAAVPHVHGQRLVRNLKAVEEWARQDTNDAHRVYELALAHWQQHHWPQTDSLLRLAARMEPRYADAYLALAYLPFARRTSLSDEVLRDRVSDQWKPIVAEAADFYQRAFRTDPMVSLDVMTVARELDEPRAIDYTPAQWLAYLRCCAWWVDLSLGRYRSASERMTKLAQNEFDEAKHPDKVPDVILLYRGLAFAHSWQYDAAIADFRALLERTVKKTERNEIIHVPLRDNDYRFMLAALHHLAGHTDSAVAMYQQALEHDLGLATAHTFLASIYEQTNRPADALLERRRAVEVDHDDPAALFDLAISLFNAGHAGEALDPLYRAIGLNPRFSPPYYTLGRIAEALNQPEEARDQYKRFLASAPLRLEDLRHDAEQRLEHLPK